MPETELMPQESRMESPETQAERSVEVLAGDDFEAERAAMTEAADAEMSSFADTNATITERLAQAGAVDLPEMSSFYAEAEAALAELNRQMNELSESQTIRPPETLIDFENSNTMIPESAGQKQFLNDNAEYRPGGMTNAAKTLEADAGFPPTLRSAEFEPGDTVPTSAQAESEAVSRNYLRSTGIEIPKYSGDAERLAEELGESMAEDAGFDAQPTQPEQEAGTETKSMKMREGLVEELSSKKKQRDELRGMLEGVFKDNEDIQEAFRELEAEISDLEDEMSESGDTTIEDVSPTDAVEDPYASSPTMYVEAPPIPKTRGKTNVEVANPPSDKNE